MKYMISLSTHASTSVVFETDLTDPEEIAAAWYEDVQDMPSLCHQCAGGGRHGGNELILGDEWEVNRFDGRLSIEPAEDGS